MCLGVPGKIVEIHSNGSLPMGKIDYGGIVKEACLAYVPEAGLGDYVIVHVGFAISRLDEDEALATLADLNEIANLQNELGAGEGPGAVVNGGPV
jgi:hydrogenase expression/formation protein HypC